MTHNHRAYEVLESPGESCWLFTCDHASNAIPSELGDLGLPAEDLARHIAYDPGAEGVTRALAELADAPAIFSRFSRLVIDPNRGEDDPTLLMRLYDGSIIPGNRHVDQAERQRRIEAYHRPYHTALGALCVENSEAVIVALHSYTPQLKGRPPRPWQIGVLYTDPNPLAARLIASLKSEPDLVVGDNQPYAGHLTGDTMDRHAVQPDRPHVLIELRNDLIQTPKQQTAWAERLLPHLEKAREEPHV